MSIFEKDCPQCTAPNPVNAVLCACGHCFDPQAVTDKKAVVEVAIHEERLYHDYLAARVVQAEAAYEVARADASVDPNDRLKAAHALAAEQALNTARAELRQQAQKTFQLRKLTARAAPVARPTTTAPKNARAGRRKPLASAPVMRASKPRAETKPVTPIVAAPTPPPVPTRVAPPPKKQPRTAPRIAAPVMPAARTGPTPSQAFRARQAKQADAIARKALASTIPAADVPALPVPAVTAAPKPVPVPTKECPNCTAKVPPQLAQCRCGFGFNAASHEMASLPLDAAALAILRR